MNNRKKMNNNDLILIVLIVILVLCFLKYCVNNQTRETFENKKKHNNNNNEKFQTTNKDKIEPINTLLDIDKTLFGVKKDGELIYKKYPINIINYPILVTDYKYKYIYIAVFNDGGIYTKNKLTDNNWEGPHRNSYYYRTPTEEVEEKYIPMRNLAISNEGRLLGVGYDGNIYIKDTEDTDETNLYNKNFGDTFKNEWIKYHNDENSYNLIYLMLLNETDYNEMVPELSIGNKDVLYLGINNNGYLNIYRYTDTNTKKKEQNKLSIVKQIYKNDENKLYKISLDSKGHLLMINQSKELKRSDNTLKSILNTSTIEFDKKENIDKNPNILFDIIQSQDGRLYGVGSINKNITLLKQTNIDFIQPFKIIDNNTNKNQTIVIPEKHIIEYKSNYKIKITPEVKIYSLEESYDKEVNEDNQKFKTFCRAQFPNNYIDIDMLNKIDEFRDKINKLKEVKDELINIDNLPHVQIDNLPPVQG
jgi:hypothetical protein